MGPDKSDIVVTGDSISMDEARDTLADVTFHCDTETYLLLVYGRLSPEAAMASGRLVVEGDQEMVLAFGRWFKGL
jgi:putative sterol carrier protein